MSGHHQISLAALCERRRCHHPILLSLLPPSPHISSLPLTANSTPTLLSRTFASMRSVLVALTLALAAVPGLLASPANNIGMSPLEGLTSSLTKRDTPNVCGAPSEFFPSGILVFLSNFVNKDDRQCKKGGEGTGPRHQLRRGNEGRHRRRFPLWAGCGNASCQGIQGLLSATRAPVTMMATEDVPVRRPRSCSKKSGAASSLRLGWRWSSCIDHHAQRDSC